MKTAEQAVSPHKSLGCPESSNVALTLSMMVRFKRPMLLRVAFGRLQTMVQHSLALQEVSQTSSTVIQVLSAVV